MYLYLFLIILIFIPVYFIFILFMKHLHYKLSSTYDIFRLLIMLSKKFCFLESSGYKIINCFYA